MNIKRLLLIATVMLAGLHVPMYGQIVSKERSDREVADSIREEMDSRPYFSLFKDTYFVGGPVLEHLSVPVLHPKGDVECA